MTFDFIGVAFGRHGLEMSGYWLGKGPIPIFGAVLGYQVTGWCLGGRLFDSFNHEAMLFVFLLFGIMVTGWLAWLMDSSHPFETRASLLAWLIPILVFLVLGVALRIQLGA